MMRTTTEIIESARMGEDCTDEELRLCIVSMRSLLILNHSLNAKIASSDGVPNLIKMKAKNLWGSLNTGFNIPIDKRVSHADRPGNPDLYRRRDLANKIYKASQN